MRKRCRSRLPLLLCFCLCICAVCPSLVTTVPSAASVADDCASPIPLSYGRCYTTETSGCTPARDHEDDGTMLTDRLFATGNLRKEEAANWVGYTSSGKDFTVTVTLDLGAVHKTVRCLAISFIQDTSHGVAFPERVAYELSEDGKTFFAVGDGVPDCDPNADPYCGIYKYVSETDLCTRYVRATVYGTAGQSVYFCEMIAEGLADAAYIREEAVKGNTYTDSQGVVYTLREGYAAVTDYLDLGRSVTGGSLLPCEADFNCEGTYILGAGSENPVSVHAEFVSSDNINFSNLSNDIRYIVIHNTATVEPSTTAALYHRKLLRGDSDSSWHYTVDNNGTVYHSVPDEYTAWHAGSDESYSSIGIELCVNGAPTRSSGAFLFYGEAYEQWLDEIFLQTIENTAVLVAELLVRYELNLDSVIQHNDCSGKNCPQWLRYESATGSYSHDGDLWVLLMARIQYYYRQYTDTPRLVLPASDVALPDYLIFNGGISFPVTEIDGGAFAGKSKILHSIALSDTVCRIGENAFAESYGLESVIPSGDVPYFTVLDGCLFSTDGTLLFQPDLRQELHVPTLKEDSTLWIEQTANGEYMLLGIPLGCTVEELRLLCGADELVTYDETVSTGSMLLLDGAPIRAVLPGDADGNGEISIVDYIIARRILLGSYEPSEFCARALKMTDSTQVTLIDCMKIRLYLLEKYPYPETAR